MRRVSLFAVLAVIGSLVAPAVSGSAGTARPKAAGPDDAVVVAVLDYTFTPYHWDFLASKMPQAQDRDPSNDLPLASPPHEWLTGFPNPRGAFSSYERFGLTLEEKDPNTAIHALDAKDAAAWAKVKSSGARRVNYYWMPNTKIIGAIEFGSQKIHGGSSEHGTGVTSVSVGNIHGTCPECLLVFLDIDTAESAENAMKWATSQPWIDVVTNSYGHGDLIPKIYNGPTVSDQKRASERGQTIFFSAGNGIENAWTATNPTYLSSQKGPDWLITVGAVHPRNRGSYFGHGKPADVAGVGGSYPSAYGSASVSGTGSSGFGGTSNAAPTIAGTYARALYLSRVDLGGPSRVQRNGVIARGTRYRCGRVRPKCELGDGVLTATELRTRLLHGAAHTPPGMTDPLGLAGYPAVGEEEFVNEGHGTYFARLLKDKGSWLKEFDRLLGPLEGRTKVLARPDGEREWMIVDSFCRQHIWGSWRGGYYVEGKTELPGPDPVYPIRSSIEIGCPALRPPP